MMAQRAALDAPAVTRTRGRLVAALASPRAVAVLVFVGALGLRLALAAQLVFPPLGDAAYYIAVAQSLYAGHGFTVGIVWHYQPPPPAVVGPSNDYWGPLPSIVEWLGMLLFGDHLLAALLPGAVAGALLVALTYLCGRRVLRKWLLARGASLDHAARASGWLALGAAALLAVNAELTYQSVMGDSGMLYGLIGFAAILLWERALHSPPSSPASAPTRAAVPMLARVWGWPGASVAAWGAGALLGLAYLTRGSFLFLALALAGWWVWRWRAAAGADTGRSRAALAGSAAALVAGALIVVAPWLLRQQMVFGHLFSPEAAHNALAFSIEDFADYGAAPTLATMLAHGPAALLNLRADALWNDWHHVADYLFYPTALPAVAGLVLLARRQATARLGLVSAAVLLLGFALLFPAVTLFGGFYHSVASVAPFLAWGYLAAIYAVAAWARPRLPLRLSLAPALAAIPILLQAALLAFAFPAIATSAAYDRQTFASISQWLHAHHTRVVMTNQSSSLSFASGIPAIELPAGQSPAVAYACAQRYGAQYLVVYGAAGRYPAALRDAPNPHFILVDQAPGYSIYQIAA
jgi:4-amino-4-deoxy-L-arabinose transferase-like glycosyltransferase